MELEYINSSSYVHFICPLFIFFLHGFYFFLYSSSSSIYDFFSSSGFFFPWVLLFLWFFFLLQILKTVGSSSSNSSKLPWVLLSSSNYFMELESQRLEFQLVRSCGDIIILWENNGRTSIIYYYRVEIFVNLVVQIKLWKVKHWVNNYILKENWIR